MKKVIVFLLAFVLILSSASAGSATLGGEEGSWSVGSGDKKGSIILNLDTYPTRKLIVGFTTSSEVSSLEEDVIPISQEEGIKLTLDRQTGEASNDSIYLYYQIESGEDITISLYGDKALNSAIAWTVTSENLELRVGDAYAEGDEKVIHSHRPTTFPSSSTGIGESNVVGAWGTYPLKITSDSVWNHPGDVYSANLYILIEGDQVKEDV